MDRQLSKVEVKGLEAVLYDQLMLILSGFTYSNFIKQVIKDMDIRINDKIIDFGSGTGKNICLMRQYTNNMIIGLDKGREMLKQSKKRCKRFNNIKIFYHDIRHKTPFIEEFNAVFISFVIHGFIDQDRDKIIEHAYSTLKPNGSLFILDYNEFDINSKNEFVKLVFKYGECPLASEFINIDFKQKLKGFGFNNFKEFYYYSNLVRLLIAKK